MLLSALNIPYAVLYLWKLLRNIPEHPTHFNKLWQNLHEKQHINSFLKLKNKFWKFIIQHLLFYVLPLLSWLELMWKRMFFDRTSLVAQMAKHLPTVRETWVQSLGREDLLEKEMATHSGILAWTNPSMEEPGRLQSVRSQRVGHHWATLLPFFLSFLHYIPLTQLQFRFCLR